MKKFFTSEEFVQNNINEVLLTEWEANGYDDSDGDILTYNFVEDKIIHHPWTTRFAAPYEAVNREIPTWENAVKVGMFSEEQLKKTFFNDIFRDWENNRKETNEKLCGYLCAGWNSAARWFGEKSMTYAIPYIYKNALYYAIQFCEDDKLVLFNPTDKTIIKRSVYITSAKIEKALSRAGIDIAQTLFDNSTVAFLCNLLSSKMSCSSSSRSWVGQDVFSVLAAATNGDLLTEVRACQYEHLKQYLSNVREKVAVWVDTKMPTMSADDKTKMVERIVNKNYSTDVRVFNRLSEELAA